MKQDIQHKQGFINKEILIAIALGFIIGLVVTYGVWTANQSIKQNEQSRSPVPTKDNLEQLTEGETNPDTQAANLAKFALLRPNPHTLTSDETINVSGYAPAESTIVIINEGSSYTTSTDTEGEFEVEISLVNGINYLTAFYIDLQGQTQKIEQTIVKTSSSAS